jgi:hypothetical protein
MSSANSRPGIGCGPEVPESTARLASEGPSALEGTDVVSGPIWPWGGAPAGGERQAGGLGPGIRQSNDARTAPKGVNRVSIRSPRAIGYCCVNEPDMMR